MGLGRAFFGVRNDVSLGADPVVGGCLRGRWVLVVGPRYVEWFRGL